MIWLLFACATREGYPEQYGTVICDRYAECFPDEYAAAYADAETCVASWEETVAGGACKDFCDFDAEQANLCLSETRTATCDEVFSTGVGPCNQVYDCDNADAQECFLSGSSS